MENATLSGTSGTDTGTSPTGLARIRVILILGALTALAPLTIDMYLPALPAIADDLMTSSSAAQLTLTGTLFGLGVGQLVIGPLSDSVGRRLPLVGGIALHVVSSALCLVAPDVVVLGLLRLLQGVGAAAAVVVATAVVRDLFTGRAAAIVLSRLILVMGAAPILAPTLGAAVLVGGSWRLVFGVLAGLGAALIGVSVFLLKETLPPPRRRSGAFRPVLRTYRSLLLDREFVGLVLVAALGMAAIFAHVSGSSFVLQEHFGLNQQEFGLVFGAGSIAIIGATQLNVVLLNRMDPARILPFALPAAVLTGGSLIAMTATGTGGMLGFVIPLSVLLGTIGFVIPNASALALSRHGEAAGTAAALLGAAQFGIGAATAPLVGVLGNGGTALAITMTAAMVIGWTVTATSSRKALV